MQPEAQQHVSQGTPGPEQFTAVQPIGPENIPSLPPIETAVERGQEAYEQRADATQAQNIGAPQVQAQPIAPQAPIPTPVAQPVSAAPLVAADEDLIEKEWVDKAKEIIQKTGDDPFARTQQVNELQRSYLQKRYGKVVGADEQ